MIDEWTKNDSREVALHVFFLYVLVRGFLIATLTCHGEFTGRCASKQPKHY